MALMPEDLMNQRFTPVRFSEGYDMDEVDNFLDNEVEPRLKELISENERLKKELEETHNRIAELESGAPAAAAGPAVEAEDQDEETLVSEVPDSAADETAPQAVVADERARAGLEDSADGRLHGQIREHPLDGALAERREGAVVCLCGPVPLPHAIQ